MAWQAITDVDIEPGKLVFSRVWRSFVDNPEAVHAGDIGSVPAGKRILIDNQASPPSATAGQILLCSTTGAGLVTDTQQIDTVAPFFFWDTVGTFVWVVPVSAWYEIQVHGGGAGGLAALAGDVDLACGQDGATVRAMTFLPAGLELELTVGAGGVVGSAGSPSLVQNVDSGLSIYAGGGPPPQASGPWITPSTGINGVALVLVDAPQQIYPHDSGLGMLAGYGVGQGGPTSGGGTAGVVLIERVSFGG